MENQSMSGPGRYENLAAGHKSAAILISVLTAPRSGLRLHAENFGEHPQDRLIILYTYKTRKWYADETRPGT
jgi:hypothetical protein